MQELLVTGVCVIALLFIDILSLSKYSWTSTWNISLNVCLFWFIFVLYDLRGDHLKKEVADLLQKQETITKEPVERMEKGEPTWEIL